MFESDQKERITKAKIKLNYINPFFTYILLNMKIDRAQSDDKIPTMGVNALGELTWNDEFVSKLTDEYLYGVLAHEAMHMATLTFPRKENRDHMIWNIATDLVINSILLNEKFSLPTDCVRPDNNGDYTFTGANKKKITIHETCKKTAEEVYDILITHADKIYVDLGTGDGNGGNGQPRGSYKGSFDSHDHSKTGNDASKKANEEKWKKITVEAATSAKQRGAGGDFFERILNDLLDPEIDWRAKLSQFITKDLPVDYTMRRPGRRFYSSGVYYPSVVRENLDVVIGIDVSGSISDDEYSKFMAEVMGIANSYDQINMRVIWWSTEVHNEDDIIVNRSNSHEIAEHKFHSTGGTTMSCFAEHIEKANIKSNVYVILTDGHIESNPKVPEGNILFVLAGNSSSDVVKNYGEICKLKIN